MQAVLPPTISRGACFYSHLSILDAFQGFVLCQPLPAESCALPSPSPVQPVCMCVCVYTHVYMYMQQAYFILNINKHKAALYFVHRGSACCLSLPCQEPCSGRSVSQGGEGAGGSRGLLATAGGDQFHQEVPLGRAGLTCSAPDAEVGGDPVPWQLSHGSAGPWLPPEFPPFLSSLGVNKAVVINKRTTIPGVTYVICSYLITSL